MRLFLASNFTVMKTAFLLLISFCLSTSISAQAIYGSGKVTESKREFTGIKGLSIKGHFRVTLVQGDKEEVVIKTDDNLHDYVVTELNDGVLAISVKKGKYKKVTSKDVTVYYKNLESIQNTGSGDIKTENQLSAGTLAIKVVGSGDIDLNISATEVNVDLSGSGDVALLGNSIKLNISVFGSGDVNAFNMQTQDVAITLSGSGNIKVYANSSLSGSMAGSGDVYYKGAAVPDVSQNGSGELIKE
jgi:hypothetical protein